MRKFTLRSARVLSGYSIAEMANHCSISEGCYQEYENDFGKTPAKVAHAIRTLLGISLDSIYI